MILGPANELAVSDVEERRTVRIRRLSRHHKLASPAPTGRIGGTETAGRDEKQREEEEQQVFLHPATKDLPSMSSFINHKLRSI